jgi:hypothetical protein
MGARSREVRQRHHPFLHLANWGMLHWNCCQCVIVSTKYESQCESESERKSLKPEALSIRSGSAATVARGMDSMALSLPAAPPSLSCVWTKSTASPLSVKITGGNRHRQRHDCRFLHSVNIRLGSREEGSLCEFICW